MKKFLKVLWVVFNIIVIGYIGYIIQRYDSFFHFIYLLFCILYGWSFRGITDKVFSGFKTNESPLKEVGFKTSTIPPMPPACYPKGFNDGSWVKNRHKKTEITEVVEIGYPKCIIQREGQPITELIEVEDLAEELAKKLDLISYE